MEDEELPVEVDEEYEDPYEDDRKYLSDIGYISETYSE